MEATGKWQKAELRRHQGRDQVISTTYTVYSTANLQSKPAQSGGHKTSFQGETLYAILGIAKLETKPAQKAGSPHTNPSLSSALIHTAVSVAFQRADGVLHFSTFQSGRPEPAGLLILPFSKTPEFYNANSNFQSPFLCVLL